MILNFKTFLKEIVEIPEERIDQFVEKIKSECKPFLKEAKGDLIFRGTKSAKAVFIKKNVRTDRRPLDSKISTQRKLNAGFNAVFGIKARSECLFTIGSVESASGYGNAFAIFPIGKFDYIWSPTVDDLYNIRHSYERLEPEALAEWIKYHYYKNQKLTRAIIQNRGDCEIMIKCKSYYGMFIREPQFVDILKNKLKG